MLVTGGAGAEAEAGAEEAGAGAGALPSQLNTAGPGMVYSLSVW